MSFVPPLLQEQELSFVPSPLQEPEELSAHHLLQCLPWFPKVLHAIIWEFADDACIRHFELFQARANQQLGELKLQCIQLEFEQPGRKEATLFGMIRESMKSLDSNDLFPMLGNNETENERLCRLVKQGRVVLDTLHSKAFNEELYAQMTSLEEPREKDPTVTLCWETLPLSQYQFLTRLSSLHDACPTTLLLFYFLWRGLCGEDMLNWIAARFQKKWGRLGTCWFLYVAFYVLQHLAAKKIMVKMDGYALQDFHVYYYVFTQIVADSVSFFSEVK